LPTFFRANSVLFPYSLPGTCFIGNVREDISQAAVNEEEKTGVSGGFSLMAGTAGGLCAG
jgi:hypothetical protein